MFSLWEPEDVYREQYGEFAHYRQDQNLFIISK